MRVQDSKMKGNAKAPRFQGAGTLVVNPTKLDDAYDAFVKLGLDVIYSQDYEKCKHNMKS